MHFSASVLTSVWALGFWNLIVKNLKDFFPAQKPQSFFENLIDFFETQ